MFLFYDFEEVDLQICSCRAADSTEDAIKRLGSSIVVRYKFSNVKIKVLEK